MKFVAQINGKKAEWDDQKLQYVGDKDVINKIRDIEATSWFCDDSFLNVKVILESWGYTVEYEADVISDDIIR